MEKINGTLDSVSKGENAQVTGNISKHPEIVFVIMSSFIYIIIIIIKRETWGLFHTFTYGD